VPKCCNKYLVPHSPAIFTTGAKVPAILSVPGAKVPGSVRLGARHVAWMEDVATRQLHAHQAPVRRVPAHTAVLHTLLRMRGSVLLHTLLRMRDSVLLHTLLRMRGSNFRYIPDNGDVEPVLTVVVTPAGQPVCGEYRLALHRARALALSQEQAGHSPAQVSQYWKFQSRTEPAKLAERANPSYFTIPIWNQL
jgi:hypothetical protein